MNITTSELVYINEAAKALKQKDFILIDNAIIGLDNIQSIVTYILLDNNFISNYFGGIIINQRALSAFIKTLSVESDFEFDSTNNVIRTISGGELSLGFDRYLAELTCSMFKYSVNDIENTYQVMLNEEEVSYVSDKLQNMKKADGAIGINHNGYYMTIFPSILPITKTDKIYLKILQQFLL